MFEGTAEAVTVRVLELQKQGAIGWRLMARCAGCARPGALPFPLEVRLSWRTQLALRTLASSDRVGPLLPRAEPCFWPQINPNSLLKRPVWSFDPVQLPEKPP